METILAMGFVCMACFLMGAKVGQAVAKGEDIKLPSINQAVKEHKERKVAEVEQSRYDTILQNIEKYNGTSNGQQDVP